MALLHDEDLKFLTENFGKLQHDVTLKVIAKQKSALILPGQDDEEPDDASAEVKQVIDELAATSGKLKVEHVAPEAGERTPTIAFSSPRAKGKLRYIGLPAGYEMSTLVGAIMDLGIDDEILPPEITQRMGALKKDVHIQVFVTPT